jgi:hypothetical protein
VTKDLCTAEFFKLVHNHHFDSLVEGTQFSRVLLEMACVGHRARWCSGYKSILRRFMAARRSHGARGRPLRGARAKNL